MNRPPFIPSLAPTQVKGAKDVSRLGERKRTSLGYQRIPIACKFCRRRKIRCLYVGGDREKRCRTCVRFNKECIFHSIHQDTKTMPQLDIPDETGFYSGETKTNTISASSLRPTKSLELTGRLKGSKSDHMNAAVDGLYLSASLDCPTLGRTDCTTGPSASDEPDFGVITTPFTESCSQYAYGRTFSKVSAGFIPPSNTSQANTEFFLQPLQRRISVPLAGDCPLDFNPADLSLNLFGTSAAFPLQAEPFSLEYPCTSKATPAISIVCHEQQEAWVARDTNAMAFQVGQTEGFLEDSSSGDSYATLVKTHGSRLDTFSELRMSGDLYNRRTKPWNNWESKSPTAGGGHVPKVNCSIENLGPISLHPTGLSKNLLENTHYKSGHAAEWQTTDCFDTLRMHCSFGSDYVATEQSPRTRPPLRSNRNFTSSQSRCFEDYIVHLRSLLLDGTPEDEVLGPTRICLDWLFADGTYGQNIHLPLSQWISGIVSTFDVLGVPEKIGLTVLYSRYLKWFVTRSLHDYYRIPQWLRPTTTQTTIEHDIWIDFILWPDARDVIVKLPSVITEVYEEISGISGHLYMSWPYNPHDLIDVDPNTGVVHASPLVERCAQDIGNWSLDATVASLYPLLTGCVQIANHENREVQAKMDDSDILVDSATCRTREGIAHHFPGRDRTEE